jgi:acylphosphatase
MAAECICVTMGSEKLARVHVLVKGHVQGVAYRAFVQAAAVKYGVRGGVRNLTDGSVAVEAEGDRHAIEDLLACLKAGPPRARVDAVQVEWQAPTGLPVDFQIWY